MERRKFLIGAGSAAVGSSAIIGSGAFTSVQADRTVTVQTANDSGAYLTLDIDSDRNDNSEYATQSDGTVSVTLDQLNIDATTTAYNIFTIINEGTQPALVYAQPSGLQDQGAYDESVDNIYFDPQFSNMPSDGDDTLGTLPDGTRFGSLTGVGRSVDNFEEQVLKSNSNVAHDAETFILNSGQSFDFGVYARTVGEVEEFDYNVTIEADAALARAAREE